MSENKAWKYIFAALVEEMKKRHTLGSGLSWIENERLAVATAANEWAEANGISKRVTVEDVERVEHMAMGHIDYATKLSIYVSELLYDSRKPSP